MMIDSRNDAVKFVFCCKYVNSSDIESHPGLLLVPLLLLSELPFTSTQLESNKNVDIENASDDIAKSIV